MNKMRSASVIIGLLASQLGYAQLSQEQPGSYVCLIEPDAVVDVGFPVWGVVENIAVERGDEVEQGQLIAELQSGVEKATIAINEARLQFEERNRNRNMELRADGHVSAFEVDQSDTQTQLARLELERSEENLNLRRIYSPISGVVAERMASPGEYVQEQPVLQLAKLDPLKVEVVLPVNLLGKIQIGDTAVVYPEEPIQDSFTATVTIVDRLVDAASGTMGVTLEMANPGNSLPAGLKCDIEFQ